VTATGIRAPAVAGSFYPADPDVLARQVDALLDAVPPASSAPAPKAFVLPHAGYVYSGPIAATGYAMLRDRQPPVTRVVLLGPAHYVPVRGLATSSADTWRTPLGEVPIDAGARADACELPGVSVDDAAHAPEHSLEVHVPFLQRVLGDDFALVPFVVGRAEPEIVAAVLDVLWGGPETVIVASSDLSHYLDHPTATARDTRTASRILSGSGAEIAADDACGAAPIRGLLVSGERHGLSPRLLDLRNSGDTAGPRDRVVGYGAFALEAA
jgi:AmmeMemoRadiSam system protein B